jgi:ligand-binding sensor domain-containing protein/uncharacterized membrane protein
VKATDIYARNYTVADGLPSNNIYFVTADNQGILWFCTDLGLSKYDGQKFTNLGIDQGLPDEEVFQLLPDSLGRYWMLNHSGTLSYIKNDSAFALASQPSSSIIRSMTVGSDNSVHLSYYNNLITVSAQKVEEKKYLKDFELVWYYDNVLFGAGDFSYWNLNTGKKVGYLGFTGKYSNRINRTNELISISEGLKLILLNGTEKIDSVEIGEEYAEIIYSKPIDKNTIWIGTRNGILLYDFRTKQILESFLQGLSITSLVVDFEGNTWFSTLEQGVFKWPNSKVKTFKIQNEYGTKVRSLLLDNNKIIWVGLLGEKYGVIKPDNTLETYHIDLTNEGIVRIREYDNQVWLITKQFAVNSATGDKLNNYLNDLYVSSKLNLLFTSQVLKFSNSDFNGLLNIEKPLGVFSEISYDYRVVESKGLCVLEANEDNVLLGTIDGLYNYNISSNSSQKLFEKEITTAVLNMVYYSTDTIVISTQGNGLFWIKGNKIVARLDNDKGLPSSNIRSTHIDEFGRLWLNSSNQLFVVPGLNKSPINISNQVGLRKHTIESITSRNGHIYLATEQGVLFFKYPSVAKPKAPLLSFQDVYVNDELVSEKSDYNFNYNENKIAFNVQGISYLSENDLRYEYQLLPLHKNWQNTNSNRVEFNALQSGNYTFQIRAVTSNGVSTVLSRDFEIKEAFFYKTWFQLIIMFLISIVMFIVFRWRINRINKRHYLEKKQIETQREKERIERKLAELQERALRNQMNPHFVFNALNTIKGFYAENDVARAGNYLQKFSKLLRVMLTVDEGTIKLENELELISLYCELMQIRHDYHFNYQIEVEKDSETSELLIPAMLVQPFVENAIIHGLVPKKESGTVSISVEEHAENLRLIIEDNGVGRSIKSNAAHVSKATEITKERLMLLDKLNKTKAQINIVDLKENNKPTGTKVIIEIPIVYEF